MAKSRPVRGCWRGVDSLGGFVIVSVWKLVKQNLGLSGL